MVFCAATCIPAVQAQNTDSTQPTAKELREQPLAPYPAILSSTEASESALDLPQAPTAATQVAADERPLSGVQELTAGPHLGFRNFLVPSVTALSQTAFHSSDAGFDRPAEFAYLVGTLDVNHVSERSEFLLSYTGGGSFSSYLNSAIQDLQLSQSYRWRRWSLLVGDQVSFLTQSPFGFAGLGGLAFFNGISRFGGADVPGPLFDPSFLPNQTIPTIIVPRLSHTILTQVGYNFSPRATWTAAASYGTLNYFGVGFINSASTFFQTGYNYQLTPQTTTAVTYRFDDFRYTHFHQRIADHIVQLSYARHLTSRLQFQVAAGPSVALFRGLVTGSSSRVSWALNSSLDYRRDSTSFFARYDHLVTAGSGVLVGAQTDQAEAVIEQKLSSRWQNVTSVGYAINRNLIANHINTNNGHFDSWYASFRFNRQMGPTAALFFAYGARLQLVDSAACSVVNCGRHFVAHELSAGVTFGFRPIALQ